MNVHFKYPRKINNKHYAPGGYEVPDTYADDWYFKGLLRDGDVVILDKPVEPFQESKDADLDKAEPKIEKPKKSKKVAHGIS